MNKGELVSAVAHKLGLSKTSVENVLNTILHVIAGALEKKDQVRLIGFGTFKVVSYKKREVRNPQTGKIIVVPGGKRPKFVPSPLLKDTVNK